MHPTFKVYEKPMRLLKARLHQRFPDLISSPMTMLEKVEEFMNATDEEVNCVNVGGFLNMVFPLPTVPTREVQGFLQELYEFYDPLDVPQTPTRVQSPPLTPLLSSLLDLEPMAPPSTDSASYRSAPTPPRAVLLTSPPTQSTLRPPPGFVLAVDLQGSSTFRIDRIVEYLLLSANLPESGYEK
jgi:hypothetical protein